MALQSSSLSSSYWPRISTPGPCLREEGLEFTRNQLAQHLTKTVNTLLTEQIYTLKPESWKLLVLRPAEFVLES